MLTFNEKLEEIKRLKKSYRREDMFDATELGYGYARCVDHDSMYEWCRSRAEEELLGLQKRIIDIVNFWNSEEASKMLEYSLDKEIELSKEKGFTIDSLDGKEYLCHKDGPFTLFKKSK